VYENPRRQALNTGLNSLCKSAIYTKNSGFVSPALGRHISTFRGYRMLLTIRNPYINRFINHFSIHSYPSYPQKVVLHSITARFCLRSYYSAIWLPFSTLASKRAFRVLLLELVTLCHWIFSFQHILYYFLLLCFDL
jgi:hypothetical protein